MGGDSYTQYGAGSIGKAEHTGSGDIVAGGKRVGGPEAGESAIETLLAEVRAMRQHLGEGDRAEVDAAIEELNSNPPEDRFRRLLGTFSGIATLVGEAGVPVINAVRALLG
ncbi:hypothetical protein J7E99_00465 [Streptomyces sp. ISL-44]|uniref:hypothetical protein n=1 Tax=Streptomyces sp. ISL-44 TaxID=2819184 RepID=UPI001BEBF6B7|nr:hypothetical protein [Streptomyces sp. ISL-44]MBT2539215.1 hypothetical protein [Streptomyces sp. ISL-44]